MCSPNETVTGRPERWISLAIWVPEAEAPTTSTPPASSWSGAFWYPFHYASQNDYFSIMSKASECAGFAGRLPNFIAVDYYQRGDNGGPKAANMAVDARWKVQKSDVWEDR